MHGTEKQKYSADSHIAEIYDQIETETDDIEFIIDLLGARQGLAIFEPFCGSGRIAIPLARAGHNLTGLDESEGMLSRFRSKLEQESQEVRGRVNLVKSTVFAPEWPKQQDVVLLGGNCFYEVCSSDEQRALIHRAFAALRDGGHVFIDNDDHQSMTLSTRWQNPPGRPGKAFPTGVCEDGTKVEGSTETAWYDIHGRFSHYIRRVRITDPDGAVFDNEWRETCHPVIMQEMLEWVEQAGFVVEKTFGDRAANPYSCQSDRALIWAKRK